DVDAASGTPERPVDRLSPELAVHEVEVAAYEGHPVEWDLRRGKLLRERQPPAALRDLERAPGAIRQEDRHDIAAVGDDVRPLDTEAARNAAWNPRLECRRSDG